MSSIADLDGSTARFWRLRAPAGDVDGSGEWHIYSMRFLNSTSCASSSVIVPSADFLERVTSSGTFCNSSPQICGLFKVHAPSNALIGQPGLEHGTSPSSAWRGIRGTACNSSRVTSACDVWLSFDFGVSTYVGCVEIYQAGAAAKRIVIETRDSLGPWLPIYNNWLAQPACPELDVMRCCSGADAAVDRWKCSHVDSLPLLPFPPPQLPPPPVPPTSPPPSPPLAPPSAPLPGAPPSAPPSAPLPDAQPQARLPTMPPPRTPEPTMPTRAPLTPIGGTGGTQGTREGDAATTAWVWAVVGGCTAACICAVIVVLMACRRRHLSSKATPKPYATIGPVFVTEDKQKQSAAAPATAFYGVTTTAI